jgi:hypothetical protein
MNKQAVIATAPVDAPKVLTNEGAAQIAEDHYLNASHNGDEEWQIRLANAMAHGLRYARDNGYLSAPDDEVTRLRERVKELEWALEGIFELAYSSRLDTALDLARAIYHKHH